MQSLVNSRANYRKNFIDYNAFIELSMGIKGSYPSIKYDPSVDFELFQELKRKLKRELDSREDKQELMGLSASQIGLPVHAIYIEKDTTSSVMLIDPKIGPSPKDSNPELFLKLIKCPTSPSPYHLGLFIKSAIIKSATSKPYVLEYDASDPTFTFSANLQRIIWADNGFLPGDDTPTPINYSKACDIIERSAAFKKHFRCTIHRKEITNILKQPLIIDSLNIHEKNTSSLHKNLLQLLANNINKEWIERPSINLFKEKIIS